MLRLDLFKSRNFAVGNVETLALYGGLSALFFFLVLYLQQVARYTPLQSGLALLICRTRSRVSRSTDGRPDLERQRQKRRKP